MIMINESPSVHAIPKKIRYVKNDPGKIRMECVLQTVEEINRNKRRYGKNTIQEGLNDIKHRFKEGSLLGELDHPTSSDPVRQMTVLFKEASHRILEVGWEGNKLIGILETLRSPNGEILRNFSIDGLPVGYSFRGMGDLREMREGTQSFFEVVGPLNIVTYDSVSYPSHPSAQLRKINESTLQTAIHNTSKMLIESKVEFEEKNGMICTNEGVCYLPNDFDQLVEKRILKLDKKFKF